MYRPFAIILAFALTGCLNFSTEESTLEDSEPIPETETSMEPVPTEDFLQVTPISHATMVLEWDGATIYVDPVGKTGTFEANPAPELFLVTDIHGDHFKVPTLQEVSTPSSLLIVPQAVANQLPANFDVPTKILDNNATHSWNGFTITAIPMYNLREEAKEFHEKGRGNGYLIEKNGKRVYISGDTEDIPEMRNLENIDIAFVCMNLPYTMPVNSAAEAVLEFSPKIVYPYHYRGVDGLSDVSKFEELVTQENPDITVRQLDWYPDLE